MKGLRFFEKKWNKRWNRQVCLIVSIFFLGVTSCGCQKYKATDDYYHFVNHKYIAECQGKNPKKHYSVFEEAEQEVDEELLQMLEHIVNSNEQYEPGSNEQLVCDFYNQYMTFLKSKKSSALEHFKGVQAVELDNSLSTSEMACLFDVCSVKEFVAQTEKQDEVERFVKNALLAAGWKEDEADDMSKEFVATAKECFTEFEANNDKNDMDEYDYNWDELVFSRSKKCEMAIAISGWLYEYREFMKVEYPFLQEYCDQREQSDQEKTLEALKRYLNYQMSELYAQNYNDERMEQCVEELFEEVKGQYRNLITQAKWLPEDVRGKYLERLDKMTVISGSKVYHEINAEDANLIGEDVFESVLKLKEWKWDSDTLENFKGNEMEMFKVNASYSKYNNAIYCPVSLLRTPFYEATDGAEMDCLKLQMILAHEMGHSFDKQAFCLNPDDLEDDNWITEEEKEIILERMKPIEESYSKLVLYDEYQVNGHRTLNENLADLMAMECMVALCKTKEEQQQLFYSYAQMWKESASMEYNIDWICNNVHSPYIFRVNEVLSNTDEFIEVYEIKPGDKMYKEKEERVHFWK